MNPFFFLHPNLLICFSKAVSSDLGRINIKEWSSKGGLWANCIRPQICITEYLLKHAGFWVRNQSAQIDLLGTGPGNLPCEETLQILLTIKNLQTPGVKIHFLVLIFNIFVSKWRLFNSDEILVQSEWMNADRKQPITFLLCFHD